MANEIVNSYSEFNQPIEIDEDLLGQNIFRDLAIQIIGDTCIEEHTVIGIDNGTQVSYTDYRVNPRCANMVISVTWSLFLTCTLLTLGLVRTVFNMFGGRDR